VDDRISFLRQGRGALARLEEVSAVGITHWKAESGERLCDRDERLRRHGFRKGLARRLGNAGEVREDKSETPLDVGLEDGDAPDLLEDDGGDGQLRHRNPILAQMNLEPRIVVHAGNRREQG